MFCVIYKFEVMDGKEETFVKSWTDVTQSFIDHCGALGSRLHKNSETEYIAYAQWPSKEIHEKSELPEEIKQNVYAEMVASCNSIQILFELTPVSDLLLNFYSSNN
jgi:hypothetical protein